MLRYIIKGEGQGHIVNRPDPGSDGVKGNRQNRLGGGDVSLSGGRDGVSLRSEVRDKKESDWEGNE